MQIFFKHHWLLHARIFLEVLLLSIITITIGCGIGSQSDQSETEEPIVDSTIEPTYQEELPIDIMAYIANVDMKVVEIDTLVPSLEEKRHEIKKNIKTTGDHFTYTNEHGAIQKRVLIQLEENERWEMSCYYLEGPGNKLLISKRIDNNTQVMDEGVPVFETQIESYYLKNNKLIAIRESDGTLHTSDLKNINYDVLIKEIEQIQ